jgi:hypothetical protein
MFVLNLGLHGVALARDEFANVEDERIFKKCKDMAAVRKVDEEFDTPVAEIVEEEQTRPLYQQQEEDDEELMELMLRKHHVTRQVE